MKKITRFIILGMAVLSSVAYAHNVTVPKDISELALSKITENVYVMHGTYGMPDKENKGFISNSAIVVSDKGVVIIDTGGSLQIGLFELASVGCHECREVHRVAPLRQVPDPR